jgi:hypothetical protein
MVLAMRRWVGSLDGILSAGQSKCTAPYPEKKRALLSNAVSDGNLANILV